jgi:hypothetical protein
MGHFKPLRVRPWMLVNERQQAPQPQGAGSISVPPAPSEAEFMRVAAAWRAAHFACFDPVDPSGGNGRPISRDQRTGCTCRKTCFVCLLLPKMLGLIAGL